MDPWAPIWLSLGTVGALVVAAAVGYLGGRQDERRRQDRAEYQRHQEHRRRQALADSLDPDM